MDALRGERESIKLRKITPSPYVNQKVRGEGQDRPSVGDTVWEGGSSGLQPDSRGSPNKRSLWGLGTCQIWQSAPRGNHGLWGMAGVVA